MSNSPIGLEVELKMFSLEFIFTDELDRVWSDFIFAQWGFNTYVKTSLIHFMNIFTYMLDFESYSLRWLHTPAL